MSEKKEFKIFFWQQLLFSTTIEASDKAVAWEIAEELLENMELEADDPTTPLDWDDIDDIFDVVEVKR